MIVMEVTVYFQNTELVTQLKQSRDDALQRAGEWKKKFEELSRKYADIQHVNIELVDTLRINGIRFRSTAEVAKWGK